MAIAPTASHTGSLGGQDRVFAKGYIDEVDNGASAVSVAELVAIRDRLGRGGTYTPTLTVTINNDSGSDTNNGVSAPFKTIDGMFARLTELYPGIIGRLNVNLRGATPITGDIKFPDDNAPTVIFDCRISAVANSGTVVNSPNTGLFYNMFTRNVNLSNFTLNVQGTGDLVNGATMQRSGIFSNMVFNREQTGRGIWMHQYSWLRFSGTMRFGGAYGYIIGGTNKTMVYAEGLTELKFKDGSCNQIFHISTGSRVYVYAAPAAPVYENFTRANFATLHTEGKVFLPRGAALENWTGGSPISADSTSEVLIPA